MQELEQLIENSTSAEVLAAIATWSDKQKRAAQKWLPNFWKEERLRLPRVQTPAPEQLERWMRLVIANLASANTVKQALAIPPPSHDWIDWDKLYLVDASSKGCVLEALARHGRDWAADYVATVASKNRRKPMYHEVLLALIEGFHLPLPLEGEFADMWADALYDLVRNWRGGRDATEPPYRRDMAELTLRIAADGEAKVTATPVVADNRIDAAGRMAGIAVMIPALLGRKDGVRGLLGRYSDANDIHHMTMTLAGLFKSGKFDRTALIGDILAALTRGDAVTAQRFLANLLVEFDLDPELIAPQANALATVLACGHGSAAQTALDLLRRLDEAQPIAGELFVSVCEVVFARKEKGLKEAQLAWATQRFTKHQAQAAETMHGMLSALTVDDYGFQKKAAEKIDACWPALAPDDRAALSGNVAACQPFMDAGLYASLAAVRDEERAQAAPAASMSSVTEWALAESRPVTPFTVPPTGVAEYRETLAQFRSACTVAASEQLVELSLQLAKKGIAPIEATFKNIEGMWSGLGRFNIPTARIAGARLREIAQNPQRFHANLAKPSWDNGAIDAGDLVQRLEALAAMRTDAGPVEAGPMDLLLALLRTRQPSDVELAALRAIGSRQAGIAADFLAAGGIGQMTTSWQTVKGDAQTTTQWRGARWIDSDQAEVCVTLRGMDVLPAIEGISWDWARGYTPETAPDIWQFDMIEPYLTAVMPNNGEILAALNLWGFRKAGRDYDSDGGKATALALPAFIAARGPAGPALHLAVFYAMSANDASARIAGSDGLIELIAQGRYDSELASALIAAVIECGSVKCTRLAGALNQACEAGVDQVLWPLLCNAVAAALRKDVVPAGTADLLAVASRIVAKGQLRGSIQELAQAAAKKGNSKFLTEARRLHALLTSEGNP